MINQQQENSHHFMIDKKNNFIELCEKGKIETLLK